MSSNGTLTLGKIAVSGQISLPVTAGPAVTLASLIAAALKIEESKIYYVADLTPQANGFTFAYNESAGARIPGTDYAAKKANVVNNAQHCFVKSDFAGNTVVDFIAYVDQL